jgi:hypothetical protein
MASTAFLRSILGALLFSSTRAAYTLKTTYDASNFLDSFQFMTVKSTRLLAQDSISALLTSA